MQIVNRMFIDCYVHRVQLFDGVTTVTVNNPEILLTSGGYQVARSQEQCLVIVREGSGRDL